MTKPRTPEEIAEAVAGKRCEYRGPGIVGPCAEFHEVCAATQRTNTLAILAALREAADAARREEREALRVWLVAESLPDCEACAKLDAALDDLNRARSRPEKPKPE